GGKGGGRGRLPENPRVTPTLSAGPLHTRKLTRGIAMPVRRKVFRIEEMQGAGSSEQAEPAPFEQQPREMLAELAALRELITRGESASERSNGAGGEGSQQQGLRQLKDETALIHRAITRTKGEIAALQINGLDGSDRHRG